MFTYQETAGDRVFIAWNGHRVITLTGRKAATFLDRVATADEQTAQLVMAKATGNFKRGNERPQQRD